MYRCILNNFHVKIIRGDESQFRPSIEWNIQLQRVLTVSENMFLNSSFINAQRNVN